MKKVWLVTGSASGLGRYVVEAALAAGDQVVASARRPEELAALATQHRQNLRAVKHDVVNEEEARTAVETAVKQFGRLDVVDNNAGYSKFAPFEQMDDRDFRGIIDTCFFGVVYTIRAALPVELSNEKLLPPHLLLGSDAIINLEGTDEERRTAASKWRNVSASVDYGSDSAPEAIDR